LRDRKDPDGEDLTPVGHRDDIAWFNAVSRLFDARPIEAHEPRRSSFPSQNAGAEEARVPKPLVDARTLAHLAAISRARSAKGEVFSGFGRLEARCFTRRRPGSMRKTLPVA